MGKDDEVIYCINCGEEDSHKLIYERSTASGDHYTCDNCGEKLIFKPKELK